jgi:hypothetical protein
MVKILWKHHRIQDVTWETVDEKEISGIILRFDNVQFQG